MSPSAVGKIGPYEVTERLSEASVRARTAGGREFVLKHVGPAGSTAGAIGRYARAREIMHPSLANVVGVEDHGGERYLVYQFVRGLPVHEWARARGPSRAAIARLVRDAAETLDYIHKQGVVHGNPVSGNLIVTARGEVRVVDISPDPVADPVVDVKCLGELLKGALAAGRSDTSDDLDRVVERASQGTYPTARAMAEDLRDYCDGRSLRRLSMRSATPVVMRKEFVAGLAALVGAAGVFGVLTVVFGDRAGGAAAGLALPTAEALSTGAAPTVEAAQGAVAVAPPDVPPGSAAARASPAEPKPGLREGLEAAEGWDSVDWGNPVEIRLEQEGDGKSLVVESPAGGSRDKAVAHLAIGLDLSAKRGVKLHVENRTSTRVGFALALVTKEGYFESLPVMLAPGRSEEVSFAIREPAFKAERTEWRHETAVEGRSGVTDVFFLVYNGRARAAVRLDAIRFE